MMQSGLARIELGSSNPFQLFTSWMKNYTDSGAQMAFINLATADKTGQPSNRNVVLKEITQKGITFFSPINGKKFADINENNKVSACILLSYVQEDKNIKQQIRIKGALRFLPRDVAEKYFYDGPIFSQIRSIICNQGSPVEWEDLKQRHDALLEEVENGKKLSCPEEYKACEIIAENFDFYHAYDHFMADRILFDKNGDGDWKHQRVCC